MKKALVVIFFIVLLIVGLLLYKDFGISWDEPLQRDLGKRVFNYVHHQDPKMLRSKDKYYGPFFEYILFLAEDSLQLSTVREIYETRHLLTFLFFYISTICFYFLVKELFGSWKLALLGTLLLVLSPRIFAHSFYNTKDLAFMSACIIAFYFLIQFLKKQSYISIILFALTAAIATDIRIMALMIPALGLATFFLLTLKSKKFVHVLTLSVLFVGLYTLFVYIFFPILWEDPVDRFKEAFETMANYNQKTATLYFGKSVSSFKVPWHYTLGWIAVTTPVLYIGLFFSGIVAAVLALFKRKFLIYMLPIFGWFVLPLGAVIYFKSTLYNGWRQMFFIYPALLLISIYGMTWLQSLNVKTKKLVTYAVVVQIALVIITMAKLHPHHYVYFNEIAKLPGKIEENFELDYWGNSGKQVYEHLAKVATEEQVYVIGTHLSTEYNMHLAEGGTKFVFTKDSSQATYFIDHRSKPKQLSASGKIPVYTLVVDGNSIASVYKLN